MSSAPKTIPFNIIDRSYLIPETEDIRGSYFPMSLISVVKLKAAISRKQLIIAWQTLNKKYPHLRLGYRLDYEKICWRYIPEAQLSEYLAACVHVVLDDEPIETILSRQIAINNEPLSQPVQIFIAGDYLFLRMHHSFGDGKFLYLLMQLLLSEVYGHKIVVNPISNIWWKPIWPVIWQNLGQGSRVFWQFTKSLFNYYQDYQQDIESDSGSTRLAIMSASPMAVRFKTISPDCLKMLNEVKQNISLNTLLQVIIAEQLKQLNLQENPITYTIPVDLRRYLHDSKSYYPSNLASQIRVTLNEELSWSERAASLQAQIGERLEKKMSLTSIFGEWLLLLSGKKTYQSVNRNWLLKSIHNDSRIFVLSNLGNLDSQFLGITDFLAEDFSPQLIIPLMGRPSLVFSFNTFCGQGNIALTYDPQIHHPVQIEEVLSLFDAPKLKIIAQEIAN
jgi:NRPS condensation-like uncharacterized protein